MGLPTVPGLLLSLVRWKTRGKGGLLARPGGSGHVLGVGVGAGISLLGFACRLAVPHLGLPERERERELWQVKPPNSVLDSQGGLLELGCVGLWGGQLPGQWN